MTNHPSGTGRRRFLQSVALGSAAASEASSQTAAPPAAPATRPVAPPTDEPGLSPVTYPRRFTGRKLALIAFPLAA